MSQKLSFFRYFHLMAIAVFLLFSVAFFGFSFYNIKHKFYSDVAALKESYFQTHTLPSMEELLRHPKKRYIDYLSKRYSADELVKMAQEKKVPFNSLFQIKKMTGLSA